jgi:hypothetical protein
VTVDPRQVLGELQASWDMCRGTPVATTIVVGGLVLRLEGHGSILARLLPALSHHPVVPDGTPPDLTVKIWDLTMTGQRPIVPGELFQLQGDDDLGSAETGEIRFRYDWPQRVIQAWDASTRTAWWVAEQPDTIEWWEEAAPLRPVLAWWLTAHGRYLAHGAALAIDGRAVLLVGPGGSGKSTTALRAQRAGIDFLGDDYCLVGPAETAMAPAARVESGGYHVGSLYRTVKLRPVDGPAFETQLARNEHGRKIVLSIDGERGGRLLCGADLCGVAAVEIGSGATTHFEPGQAGRVLRALAPTTFEQLPGVGGRSLRAFGTMLRSLPTGVLRLGDDPDGVVAAVRDRIEAWSAVGA